MKRLAISALLTFAAMVAVALVVVAPAIGADHSSARGPAGQPVQGQSDVDPFIGFRLSR